MEPTKPTPQSPRHNWYFRNRTKRFGVDKFNVRLKNNYDIEHAKMVKRLKTQRYEMYQGTEEIRHAIVEKGDYVTAFVRTDTVGINQYVQFGTVLDYNKENGVMKVHSPNQGTKVVNLHDSKIYELFVLRINNLTRRTKSPKPVRLDEQRVAIQQDTQKVIDMLNRVPEKRPTPQKPTQTSTQKQSGGENEHNVNEDTGKKEKNGHDEKKKNEEKKEKPVRAVKPKKQGRSWTPEEIRTLTVEQLNVLPREDMMSLIKASGRWDATYRLSKKSTDKLRAFLRKQLF
jgi:hypothetical protein